MKDGVKLLIGGAVAVALVAAFGLHARQLSSLPRPTGQAVSGVFATAETGRNQS